MNKAIEIMTIIRRVFYAFYRSIYPYFYRFPYTKPCTAGTSRQAQHTWSNYRPCSSIRFWSLSERYRHPALAYPSPRIAWTPNTCSIRLRILDLRSGSTCSNNQTAILRWTHLTMPPFSMLPEGIPPLAAGSDIFPSVFCR